MIVNILKLTGLHEYVCEFIFVYVCMYARACVRAYVCVLCVCVYMYVRICKLYRCVNACIYYIFILFILLFKKIVLLIYLFSYTFIAYVITVYCYLTVYACVNVKMAH